jgi:hypothetical protein
MESSTLRTYLQQGWMDSWAPIFISLQIPLVPSGGCNNFLCGVLLLVMCFTSKNEGKPKNFVLLPLCHFIVKKWSPQNVELERNKKGKCCVSLGIWLNLLSLCLSPPIPIYPVERERGWSFHSLVSTGSPIICVQAPLNVPGINC